jgi:Ca-activated chloride channel family protein
MRRLARVLSLVFACLALPGPALAQDQSNTILVLDGSGSMWGQIDGVNKIVIAREVVGDLLDALPADRNLGLTVYGHRRRGDCADIETVVAPGAGTIPAIREAVQGVNPRGKTPMADAVIAAAEALRYTEEKATVILVSDGVETCNPDPCAAARALEEAGIDFTAHIVGFDVGSEPEALAQMQCMAEATGGRFLTADNAGELAEALTTVAVAPEPEPVPQTLRVVAVTRPGGPELDEAIDWKLRRDGASGADGTGPGYAVDLMAGAYEIRGIRAADGAEATAAVTVPSATEPGTLRLEVIFPEPEPDPVAITFSARFDSETGEVIPDRVEWTLTHEGGPTTGIGNPFTADLAPGSYEVEAYWTLGETAQARQFVVTDAAREIALVFDRPLPSATLTAPASAPAGATIEVGFDGPETEGDFIAVEAPDGERWINSTAITKGNPLALLLPPEPGAYEIRYVLRDGYEVIARQPIEVTPVAATLDAPESAPAGSTIEVGWTGPAYPNDFIAVETPDGARWQTYTYTSDGAPLEIRLPATPGDYEIRYVMNQDYTVLAAVPLDVTELAATLTAPESGAAGAEIEVAWTGPGYDNDFIAIETPDGERWQTYTYTKEGSPLSVTLPTEPGDYEVRYLLGQGYGVLAAQPITVTAVGATLSAPASAPAGSSIEVAWTGPDYANDFIAIETPDGERWQTYTYTKEGSPLSITLPTEPGDYEVRYLLGQGYGVLAAEPITLTAVGASVTAPATAPAGATIEVAWQGPDYDNDFIAIETAGGTRWQSYTYTREGSPLEIELPVAPGDYEVRYVLGQGYEPLVAVPIRITPVTATLTAPATGVAGTEIEVAWDGPGYRNDFIVVETPGGTRWQTYTYAREGSPLRLALPDTPGDYEIRYLLGQGYGAIASVPITVTAE